MSKPGVMLYFDLLEPIQILSDSDRGRLLSAILEYGKDGKQPQFKGSLAMAWGFIRPRLDRDGVSYESSAEQRKYAAFCKKRSAGNLSKIPFHKWRTLTEDERLILATEDYEPERPAEPVNARDPSASAATATATAAFSSATADKHTNTALSAAAAVCDVSPASAAAEKKLKFMNGELGRGVVVLSEYQVDLLLEKLGLEMFDYYVSKLAGYILQNDASVKNHYATILRWWSEDAAC